MLLSVCHLGMFFALLFLDAMCFRYILASAEAKMKINVSDHGFYALSICTGSAKGTFIKRGKRGSAVDSFKSEIHKTR